MTYISGRPLGAKLGIKERMRLCVVNPQKEFFGYIQPLPESVVMLEEPVAPLDMVVLFAFTFVDMEESFHTLTTMLAPAGMLWVAWPKKVSGVPSDLSFDIVQRLGLEHDLVDVKICAIDEVWSGLKFVVPVRNRPSKSRKK